MLTAKTARDSFDIQLDALEKPLIVGTATSADQFWRKAEPVFVEEGGKRRLVRGGMWDFQRSWWDLPNFVKVIIAGYGAGKTNPLCKRVIASALQNAPRPVACVSPTFGMARKTTIATLEILLTGKQRQLGKSFWWRYNKSTHEFHIKYHGRTAHILILSGDDPQNLKGSNLAAAYIDEPFMQDEEVFNQIVSRVRDPDAVLSEIGLAGTPESGGLWGQALIKGVGSEGTTNESMKGLSVGVVNGSTTDNKALDPAYVQRLLSRLSPKAAAAYVRGEWVNLTEGRVFYAFDDLPLDKGGHIIRDPREQLILDGKMSDQRLHGIKLGVGMDFNVTPMSAVVFWQVGDHTHFFEEILMENSDTLEMATVLRGKKYGKYLKDVYPDPSGRARTTSSPEGKTDFYYLEQKGFTVNAAYSDYNFKDTLNIVNGRFRSASGKQSQITVSPRCEKLIEYLNAHSHKMMNKQQHMKHLLDAFRYPHAFLFPLSEDMVREGLVTGA